MYADEYGANFKLDLNSVFTMITAEELMTLDAFKAMLTQSTPPAAIGPILKALWHDAKGDWAAAHAIAQGREGTVKYDRLHAYLHRKEGDEFNAGYWYRRAKVPVFVGSLDEEWLSLATAYLQ